jgi:hypothetical protein
MAIVTIYCLFGDDIRQAAFNANEDPVFYYLTSISLGLFTIEIILSCLFLDDYVFSFYFWLDCISTVSLIFDIGWIMDLIIGVSSSNSGGGNNV